MSTSILFKCMHCNREIEIDQRLSGQEVICPGCSKAIIIPGNEDDTLLENSISLKNRSKKEAESIFSKRYKNTTFTRIQQNSF